MDVFLNTITWDVFSFERLVLICCLQSKGTRTSSTKPDDFVGFQNIRSLTSSGWWLQKSSKHVGPNFTLKLNTKASSLQFCKTEFLGAIRAKHSASSLKVFICNFCLSSNISLSWLDTSFFPHVHHLWIRCIGHKKIYNMKYQKAAYCAIDYYPL